MTVSLPDRQIQVPPLVGVVVGGGEQRVPAGAKHGPIDQTAHLYTRR